MYFDFEFALGDRMTTSSVDFRFQLKPEWDEATRTEKDNGDEHVTVPYSLINVDVRPQLRHSEPSDTLISAEMLDAVSRFAMRVQHYLKVQTQDRFIDKEQPPEPSKIDKFAWYMQTGQVEKPDDLVPGAKKDRLKEIAENAGLPKYGTKGDIRERIYEHAEEHGDAEKAKTYNHWLGNRCEAA